MWRRRWERRGARGHSAAAGGRRWQAALGACPVPPSASQVPKAVRGSITSCPNCRTPARSAWRMRRGCTPHAGRCDPDRALLAPTARAGRTQACASHVRGAAAVAPAPLFPFSRVNARSARAPGALCAHLDTVLAGDERKVSLVIARPVVVPAVGASRVALRGRAAHRAAGRPVHGSVAVTGRSCAPRPPRRPRPSAQRARTPPPTGVADA